MANKKAIDLPLSPAQLRSAELDVPTHEADAPIAEELPKLVLVVADKAEGAESDPAPDVPPSMPSGTTEIRTEPAAALVSRPRVLLRGNELDPFTIFPPEGRRAYDDQTFPWRCVCQVASGVKGGSGVLIGSRHVLTASHVFDWRANSASVTLIQGGRVLDRAAATHVMAYEKIDDVTYNNADDDYAVLILNKRLGDPFGILGCKTYDSDWDDETANWHNIAYAPDFSNTTPVHQTSFFLDEDDFDLGGGRMLITKTGDFVKGMSGSPVFGFWNNGPFVVGVASAGASGLGNYNAIAGGNNLTRLVNKARADFP
jgi:V8-like Glu-specific endopeptidase